MNLAHELESALLPSARGLVARVGEASARRGYRACLVGGAVRDLMLGRSCQDIDIIIEGDAHEVARDCTGPDDAPAVFHKAFGTATITSGQQRIDLATARHETYARPGALPDVRPGSIEDDLVRRDFSINAMAVMLNAEGYGNLLDPHGGRLDLEHGLLRVLHGSSFVDDATRIFRGVRYEQRFGFVFERNTRNLLAHDVSRVADLSGARVRHEIERIMEEAEPELCFRRLDALRALDAIVPGLAFSRRQAAAMTAIRTSAPGPSSLAESFWCVLLWPVCGEGLDKLTGGLSLTRRVGAAVGDCADMVTMKEMLDRQDLAPSRVFELLHSKQSGALVAAMHLLDGAVARRHVQDYLERWRHVRTSLTGQDLRRLGFSSGPDLGRALAALRANRLDGNVTNAEQEQALAKALLRGTDDD